MIPFASIPKGTAVLFKDGSAGVTTGGWRQCSCGSGIRLGVRRATDKKLYWLCSKTLNRRLTLEVDK